MRSPPPYFYHFGAAYRHDVLFDAWHGPLPAHGVVHLHGSATACAVVRAVLARQQLPEGTRIWGGLSYGHLDWRIAPAAGYLNSRRIPVSGSVLVNLLPFRPTADVVAILEAAPRVTPEGLRWTEQLLANVGLATLDVMTDMRTLSPNAQQRIMLARELARDPTVLVVESSTLDDAMLKTLRRLAETRLIVTLNLDLARTPQFGGQIIHLAPSRPVHAIDTEAWQTLQPPPPAPADTQPPPPTPPAWFRWIIPGLLAGMPRPGLSNDPDDVITTLRTQRIHHIVCLEETPTSRAIAHAAGLTWEHVAIDDMGAPPFATARALTQRLVQAMAQGHATVLHCKAGIGRTGTLLACCLIHRGYTYPQALMLLRQINPHYIQSSAQHDFLRTFANQETPP